MGLQINNNIAAFNSYRNLSVNQGQMEKSLEKLSSGFRINRAADDAAGLAISEGLRSQVGGLKQAVRNAQDGISVVQTAEGALTEVHAILQRVRDLTVQASNTGSVNEEARGYIGTEITQLSEALTDIASRTEFNGTKLLNTAAAATPLVFQTGSNEGETVSVTLTDVSAVATAVATVGTNVAAAGYDPTAATDLSALDTQISTVSEARATLGASQNRFESTIKSLNVAVENLSASESRIRDTDMALEMVNFSKNQILSQAGTAMLAQAKDAPQGVLQLLR
ncbi:flagellin [Aquipuribacter hungaricus]|uniref:Flagellin n=1 Tax=Aquipuribacter hungaricus TaxID=545624 RepID=A0ABV7WKI1_9MICO